METEPHDLVREIPCPNPACGLERGTNPNCDSCRRYNPELRIKKPKFGPGSDDWERTKKRIFRGSK